MDVKLKLVGLLPVTAAEQPKKAPFRIGEGLKHKGAPDERWHPATSTRFVRRPASCYDDLHIHGLVE